MNWCHCADRVPRGVSTQFYESGHHAQPRGTNSVKKKKYMFFVEHIKAEIGSDDTQ